MREFDTGATRNDDTDQLDYEGFLHPVFVKRYAEYMHRHRIQADGKVRSSDNWQRGMPADTYIKSLLRHVVDLWLIHRGRSSEAREPLYDALMAIVFNVQGYLMELERRKNGKQHS